MTSRPGRGGLEHKYLQSLVKKFGEERGFEVHLEHTVLDGHGHIDVVLERDGVRLAIEITVTTSAEHEVENLTKCLAADFDHAVLVSTDERALVAARREVSIIDDRLRFLMVVDLPAFLDGLAAPPQPNNENKPSRRPGTPGPTVDGKRPVLGTNAAADYLKLARQTLAKFRVTGEGPAFFKLGRQVVYDPDDLDRWLAERKRRSTSDPGTGARAR